ncbi:citrate synthase-like protein [Aspergillus coremiiformis]|uniref:Citrate synthase n=1 Tax=Aspergillus coremiiformis TaxID=138285 RepID=A0A5N6Z820_9EURO|nr:citrate synthase-like protein [Aspergillus coremiiformis]
MSHSDQNGRTQPKDTLTVTDNRTARSYEIPIVNNAVKATDFRWISSTDESTGEAALDRYTTGLKILDPGFQNTAVTESEITYIDGVRGSIQYRNYTLDELLERHDFEDVSFLLVWDHLPSPQEKIDYRLKLAAKANPPQAVLDTIKCFPRDTPYHLMFVAGLSAWASTDPTTVPIYVGKEIYLGKMDAVDEGVRRTIAASMSVTALIYCHYRGIQFTPPDSTASMAENILLMMGVVDPTTRRPDPKIVRILNRLWIVYADHEMTNSTAASMHVGSGLADPMSCVSAAACALSGPLHGGAIDLAYRMFERIGKKEAVAQAIEEVKANKFRLFGYGHRIYKTVDPRVKHLKNALGELSENIDANPHLSVALEIERLASQDDYFRSRNLNVNADLYGCFVFSAMGFKPEIITALMLVARTSGIVAHWREQMQQGKPANLWRPRQVFTRAKL